MHSNNHTSLHSSTPSIALKTPATLSELEDLARRGDANAQYTLGYLHYAQCANTPWEWFAKHMRTDGYSLCEMFHLPRASYATARLLLNDASSACVPSATKMLGTLYECGCGVDRDVTKALEFYRRAAANGSTLAYCRMGHILLLGAAGVEPSHFEAFNHFSRAAALGCPDAMYNTGILCQHGVGTRKDEARAASLYFRAIETSRGDKVSPPRFPGTLGRALYAMAMVYHGGVGVPRDPHQALMALKESAKLGCGDAVHALETMYADDGIGVSRDAPPIASPSMHFRKSLPDPPVRADVLWRGPSQAVEEMTTAMDALKRENEALRAQLFRCATPSSGADATHTTGDGTPTNQQRPMISNLLPSFTSLVCDPLSMCSELFRVFRNGKGEMYSFRPVAGKRRGTAPGTMYVKMKPGTSVSDGPREEHYIVDAADYDPAIPCASEAKPQWMGKIGAGKALHTRDKYTSILRSRKRINSDAIFEKVGGDGYAILSDGRYLTPKTRLARLPVMNAFLADHELAKFIASTLRDECKTRRASDPNPKSTPRSKRGRAQPVCTLRVMSKWIEGYVDLAELIVPVVASSQCLEPQRRVRDECLMLPFMEYLRQFESVPQYVCHPTDASRGNGDVCGGGARVVPIVGLPSLLAIGALIGDTDVLGGGGTNAGVVFRSDTDGRCVAMTCKVDPGYAFNVDFSHDVAHHHTTPNRFLNTAQRRGGSFALDDLRDVQIGNTCEFVVRWRNLSVAQQREFACAHARGLHVLCTSGVLEVLFTRGGLLVDGRDRGERLSEMTVRAHVGFIRSYLAMRRAVEYVIDAEDA